MILRFPLGAVVWFGLFAKRSLSLTSFGALNALGWRRNRVLLVLTLSAFLCFEASWTIDLCEETDLSRNCLISHRGRAYRSMSELDAAISFIAARNLNECLKESFRWSTTARATEGKLTVTSTKLESFMEQEYAVFHCFTHTSKQFIVLLCCQGFGNAVYSIAMIVAKECLLESRVGSVAVFCCTIPHCRF